MGLGHWYYVIMHGKGTKKIAFITAYNVGPSHGETTANQQQQRLLSAHIRQHNLSVSPHPHRQFILNFQSWLEHLIQEGYEIVLILDANESYNPDIPVPPHPLLYTQGQLTLDKHHDGKLSTLVSTCGLKDPLAIHHPERPFPPLILSWHKSHRLHTGYPNPHGIRCAVRQLALLFHPPGRSPNILHRLGCHLGLLRFSI
jgi:hypothetical protein